MAEKFGLKNKQDARRIATAVRVTESKDLGGQSGSRWDASPIVISAIIDSKTGTGATAKYAWTQARLDSSDTLVSVSTALSGDATRGYAVDPMGTDHATGDPVNLLRIAKAKSGGGFEVGWIILGGGGGCTDSGGGTPTTIGNGTTEAAVGTTWAAGSGPLTLRVTTRDIYRNTGDQKLYGFYVELTINSCGQIQAVTGETRYLIDTPDLC